MMKQSKEVYIRTLGCDKNTVDSEMLAGSILTGNYVLTDRPDQADIIIVNTCCFIEDAKKESIDAIFELLPYRTDGKCDCFIVAGCMAQRYATELKEEIPEADAFLGVNNLEDILKILQSSENEDTKIYTDEAALKYHEAVSSRYLFGHSVTAYLKIAEGCDKHCTYCAIPSIRGPYRSRTPEAVLKEAKALKTQGIEECILIAQDLTQYGRDLVPQSSLSELLERLATEIDFSWIRLLYLYPEGIDTKLLETIARHSNICHYLDIPVQHTEDRILKRMGRSIDKKSICGIVKQIRTMLPDVVLRTTIITGFPGETEEEFENLLFTLKELQFDRLGAFAYSQEENTPAAKLPDQIDDVIKNERRYRVYAQQQLISAEKNAEMVGRTVKVLIEGKEDQTWLGRTAGDAPDIDCGVIIESDSDLKIGRFYNVKVIQSLDYDLIGEVL